VTSGTPSKRVADFALTWGESLRWDDRRERLYFVDCGTRCLHWLDGAAPPLHTMRMPSLPTGIALTAGDEIVVCLGDGLHVVDPDAGTHERLAGYPPGMHGRANDAHADAAGNLVTGTLNLGPGAGALWWFSAAQGWRLLDDDFGNTNGPAVIGEGDGLTLVCGDTVAGKVYVYPFDAARGTVGARRVLADYASLFGGAPDGATVDADGGVWSCVLRSGKLARLTDGELDRTIDVPVANPSDLAFGGRDLRRLFMTAIAVDLGDGKPAEEASWLVSFDDVGVAGRLEPRFRM
jgi:sugar lactone lactonase YvrE